MHINIVLIRLLYFMASHILFTSCACYIVKFINYYRNFGLLTPLCQMVLTLSCTHFLHSIILIVLKFLEYTYSTPEICYNAGNVFTNTCNKKIFLRWLSWNVSSSSFHPYTFYNSGHLNLFSRILITFVEVCGRIHIDCTTFQACPLKHFRNLYTLFERNVICL